MVGGWYFSIGVPEEAVVNQALYFVDVLNLISKEYLNTISKEFFCICPLVDSFTSLLEMLLIFMTKEFLKAPKLICSLFPFCLN